MLFAKNSDREPDEAQLLEICDAATHGPGERVACTYADVPQVSRTHRVLLSRPAWMWGAEIAVNEHGLAVGNEAVFTLLPGGSFLRPSTGEGLTGMDLVRLVAERAASASAGVDVLTELLSAHGQGGRCGFEDAGFVYHNSFLLADPEEAWVVETAATAWVAERVRGVRAISNGLTIRDRHDRAMPGLAAYARDLGHHRGKGAVDFASAFSDRAMSFAAGSHARRSCLAAHLRRRPADVADAVAGLRQHAPGWLQNLRPTVCAHASWLPTRAGCQTTSSLVAALSREGTTTFVTGTSSPCVSLFKPVWLDTGLAGYGAAPTVRPNDSAWWRQHRRLAARDLESWRGGMARRRDARESELLRRALEAQSASSEERRAITENAFVDDEPSAISPRASAPRRRWSRYPSRHGST